MKKLWKNECFLAVVLICGLSVTACSPARWEHADIQQLDKNGEIVMTWEDCKIMTASSGGFFSGKMIRFKKKDGKQVTINTDYNIIYR